MNNQQISLDEIAKSIANQIRKNKRLTAVTGQSSGCLQEYIVEAYREMHPEECRDWPEKATYDQLKIIGRWYQTIYAKDSAQASKNTQGMHREVGVNTGEADYHFDYPYDENQFNIYVIDSRHPTAIFLQHIAVAFKLTSGDLDDLLVEYGYLPLHVRNLHHLVICSVLDSCDREDGDYSQFQKIKEWYYDTIRVVYSDANQPMQTIAEDAPEYLSTVGFQAAFFEKEQLSKEQFIEFVASNKQQFYRRHSALLREHKRLAVVLGWLFESRSYSRYWPELWHWGGVADKTHGYSFECFIENFCKNMPQQRYKENLINFIHGNGKTAATKNVHPTRECMILLWLFAEMYRGHSKIDCPETYITNNQLKAWASEDSEEKVTQGGNLVECKWFDIHRYLFGQQQCIASKSKDIQAMINKSLEQYGWRPLNVRSQFDCVVLQFLKFDIIRYTSGQVGAIYSPNLNGANYQVTGIDFSNAEEILPARLVLLFALAERIFAELNSPSDGEEIVYPMPCDLYEQL